MLITAEARRRAILPSNARMAGAAATVAAGLMLAMPAYSASVSYMLNQSNTLADGVDYLKVTLSDGSNGSVNFKVEILPALSGQSTGNLGIQQFAFNVIGGTDTEAFNVSSLPPGWNASNGGRMDGFGLFDLTVQGKGKSELDFSIIGVSLDTLASYVDLSTGNAPEGHVDFAAQISGLSGDSSSSSSSTRNGRTIQSLGQSLGKNGRNGQKSLLNIVNSNCDTTGHVGSGGSGGSGNDGGDGGSSQGSGQGNDGHSCDSSFRFGQTGCSGGGKGSGAYFGGPGPGTPIVPVPAAAWLFGSALALISPVRRRITRAAA